MTTFSTLFDTRGKRHLFSELTKASLENTAVEEKLVQTADMSTTVANGEEMRRRGVCVCVCGSTGQTIITPLAYYILITSAFGIWKQIQLSNHLLFVRFKL